MQNVSLQLDELFCNKVRFLLTRKEKKYENINMKSKFSFFLLPTFYFKKQFFKKTFEFQVSFRLRESFQVSLNHVQVAKVIYCCYYYYFFFGRAALDKATVLLSMSKGGKRKDSVWGSGGGQQSVNHLVKEVTTTGYCL